MCNNDLTNEITRMRLRIEGLRGLRAYIGILDLSDELDSFVSKQSQGRMIPTILDNMQYPDPETNGLVPSPLVPHSKYSLSNDLV